MNKFFITQEHRESPDQMLHHPLGQIEYQALTQMQVLIGFKWKEKIQSSVCLVTVMQNCSKWDSKAKGIQDKMQNPEVGRSKQFQKMQVISKIDIWVVEFYSVAGFMVRTLNSQVKMLRVS
jgi:hypothetical protein